MSKEKETGKDSSAIGLPRFSAPVKRNAGVNNPCTDCDGGRGGGRQ